MIRQSFVNFVKFYNSILKTIVLYLNDDNVKSMLRYMFDLLTVVKALLLMRTSNGSVSRKAEDAYPTGAPGSCSQCLVESELFIYFCYLVCMILVT